MTSGVMDCVDDGAAQPTAEGNDQEVSSAVPAAHEVVITNGNANEQPQEADAVNVSTTAPLQDDPPAADDANGSNMDQVTKAVEPGHMESETGITTAENTAPKSTESEPQPEPHGPSDDTQKGNSNVQKSGKASNHSAPSEIETDDEDSVVDDAASKSGEARQGSSKRSRAIFDKAENLPKEDASDLTDGQISNLIRQGPSVRKKYSAYFSATGMIRSQYYRLLFARYPSGELRVPASIINSNLHNWQGVLDRFESKTTGPYGTGRKQAKRVTPAKRMASEDPEFQTPTPKRAKAQRTTPEASSSARPKNPRDSAPADADPETLPNKRGGGRRGIQSTKTPAEQESPSAKKAQSKFTAEIPNEREPRVQHSPSAQHGHPDSKGKVKQPFHDKKSTLNGAQVRTNAKEEQDHVAEPAFKHSLRDHNVLTWLKDYRESDLSRLDDLELAKFLDWFNAQTQHLQYSLLGVAAKDKGEHKDMLNPVMDELHKLRLTSKKLLDHLEDELGQMQE